MNKVQDFMTKDPICCLPSTNLKVVSRLMLQYDCGEIPVVYSIEHPKIVGVITDRDIICRAVAHGLNPLQMTAEEVMTTPAVIVKLDMSIDDCCRIMKEEQIRRVPVVDEQEYCCGMVTLADIARKSETYAASMIADISRPAHSSHPLS